MLSARPSAALPLDGADVEVESHRPSLRAGARFRLRRVHQVKVAVKDNRVQPGSFRRRRHVMKLPSCKIFICLFALFLLSCSDAFDPASVIVGSRSPEFALKSLDGATVKSSSLKGEIVVLNFWATYCQPCRAEIPELNSFAATSGA